MRLLTWLAATLGLRRMLADPRQRRRLAIAGIAALAVGALLLLSLVFSLYGDLWSRSRIIAFSYAGLALAIIGISGWMIFRPERPAAVRRPNAYAQRRHSEREARAIHARLAHPPPGGTVLFGVPGVGRRALQQALAERLPETHISLAPALSADARQNEIIARRCPDDACSVLVVTQDLFSYELPALRTLASRTGGRVVVFLNKADLLRTDALRALRDSLATKCADLPAVVASGSAAPRPREIVVVDGHGREHSRLEAASPQLDELVHALGLDTAEPNT